ncbi:MAG: hypothetical protein ACFFCV_13875 [Promethearchaeota archaeon]
MTEIEQSNTIKSGFQNELFQQLEGLFEVYLLKDIREKLRKKLKTLEKMIKGEINTKFANKLEAFKIISTEKNHKFKELMLRLEPRYNIFKLVRELKNNQQYLNNLDKERRKRHVDADQYEITKGYYLQKLIDIHESVDQLKEGAITYYQKLKGDLIMLEDRRIRLTTEKLRKKITKEEFKDKSNGIEVLKHNLEEKLAFLKVEIIDLEIE